MLFNLLTALIQIINITHCMQLIIILTYRSEVTDHNPLFNASIVQWRSCAKLLGYKFAPTNYIYLILDRDWDKLTFWLNELQIKCSTLMPSHVLSVSFIRLRLTRVEKLSMLLSPVFPIHSAPLTFLLPGYQNLTCRGHACISLDEGKFT